MQWKTPYINAIAEILLTVFRSATVDLTNDEIKELALKLSYAIYTVLDENKVML